MESHSDRALNRALSFERLHPIHVQFVTPPSEGSRIARIVDGIHGTVDQHDQMIAELVSVLCFGKCVEQTLPFCDAGRNIRRC